MGYYLIQTIQLCVASSLFLKGQYTQTYVRTEMMCQEKIIIETGF